MGLPEIGALGAPRPSPARCHIPRGRVASDPISRRIVLQVSLACGIVAALEGDSPHAVREEHTTESEGCRNQNVRCQSLVCCLHVAMIVHLTDWLKKRYY